MKTTDNFKQVINTHLEGVAAADPVFAEKFKSDKKSIDKCVQYILNSVQKSGCNGFSDEEIFGMAMHYYDEESIDIGKPVNAKVVVNHTIELTEEEKAEALALAKKKAIEKLASEHKDVELTEEDKASVAEVARQKAIDAAIAKKQESNNKKVAKVKATPVADVQESLFG